MEQRLQEVLLDGEIVRWSGRPSPFKLMSIPSRTSLLLTWVLCSAALAVILGGLIPFFLRTHQAVTDLTVILMIAAFLPAMISIRPLLDKWSLEHDTIYAITNYRVLALVKNNLMYIPLGRILTHSIEARDGESGNLCFCEAVGQSSSKMLDNAILGVRCGSPAQSGVPHPSARIPAWISLLNGRSFLTFLWFGFSSPCGEGAGVSLS